MKQIETLKFLGPLFCKNLYKTKERFFSIQTFRDRLFTTLRRRLEYDKLFTLHVNYNKNNNKNYKIKGK